MKTLRKQPRQDRSGLVDNRDRWRVLQPNYAITSSTLVLTLKRVLACKVTIGVLLLAPAAVSQAPTFSAPVAYPVGEAHSITVTDVDLDGFLDVAVGNLGVQSSSVSVLNGQGLGVLGSPMGVSVAGAVHGISSGLITDDIFPDIVIARSLPNYTGAIVPNLAGSLGAEQALLTQVHGQCICVADFNNDSVSDIATAGLSTSGASALSILLGVGGGQFGDASLLSTSLGSDAIAAADLNLDGNIDLATAHGVSNTVRVMLGSGAGSFPNGSFISSQSPGSVVAVDVSGDGLPDLVVASPTASKVSVITNTGSGNFVAQASYSTPAFPGGLQAGDINGDGVVDLVTANTTPDTVSMFIGSAQGLFDSPISIQSGGDGPYSLAMGDLSDDGLLDIVVGNLYSFSLTVLINHTLPPPPPTWTDLGGGVAGSDGVPVSVGSGTLEPGTIVSLGLVGSKQYSLANLVVGSSLLGLPFKGGVLVPSVDLIFALTTDFFGASSFGGLWPSGVPAGFTTYFQWWIQDSAGPKGFAASNALAGTTP